MKRKLGVVFALFLCMAMLVSACGQSGGTADTTSESAGTASAAQTTGAGSTAAEASGLVKLPLCDPGSVTLSYAGYDSWLANYSYTDGLPVWELFEQQTGVKIDFQVYPASEMESAIQIRLASGENLPDITQLPPSWTNTGVTKYAEDGVIIQLDDLIDKYGPNIKQKMQEDKYFAAMMTSPDGHYYCAMDVMYPINEVVPVSVTIRQDWLDKLKLDVPKTYDDWIKVLTAFKTQDPNGNGKADEVPFFSEASEGTLGIMGTGAGFPYTAINDNKYAYDSEGNASFIFGSDQCKDALGFLNTLYKSGLIYKELDAGQEQLQTYIAQNVVGAFAGEPVDWLSRANSLAKDADPDVNYRVIAPPQDAGGHTAISKRFPTGMYYGITKSCKNPDIAMAWIDYIGYSKEANLIKDYGIEGKTFVYDADGNPQFTDYIMKNPDGYSPHDACRTVGSAPSILVYDTPTNFLQKYEGSAVYDSAVAMKPYMVDAMPMMIPSAEENRTYNSIWPDLNSYYLEMIYKFISGAESLDNFKTYQKTMYDTGLQSILDIKKAQYLRYLDAMK